MDLLTSSIPNNNVQREKVAWLQGHLFSLTRVEINRTVASSLRLFSATCIAPTCV